jgi:hypothetical protein
MMRIKKEKEEGMMLARARFLKEKNWGRAGAFPSQD